MICKYEYNILSKFCSELYKNIKEYVLGTYEKTYSKNSNDLIKKILMNNSCKFSDESYYYTSTIIEDEYYIEFIIGAIGNDVNKCFDFIEYAGTDHLIIFLDAFDGLVDIPTVKDEISKIANDFIGKSNYFDTISKITNIFISTTSNKSIFTSTLSTTSAARVYRYAPYIIAGKLILDITGNLTENDVYGIDYNDLIKYIDNYNLSLCGIFENEDISVQIH